MSDEELTYKGGDRDALIDVVARAVAMLTENNPDEAKPHEDEVFQVWGDSAAVFVVVDSDPSSLLFFSVLLEDVKESPALYALINEINSDIAIGRIVYHGEASDIKYVYKYPAENPSSELVATIIVEMLNNADHYDDRLKARLGGRRMNEEADDEIEV
jgi:hypothetical protein